MPDQQTPAAEASYIKLESDDEDEVASSDIKREGNTAEEPIDLDDLPEMIELKESGLACHPDRVFETVRRRYVVCLKKIVKIVKQSTKLKASLEDAARIAEEADPATFISRHDEFWASYVKRAVREVETETNKKEKMFEEIEDFEKSEEIEAFQKFILKPSRKRHQIIEANQEMTNDLVEDLKKYLNIRVSKKKRARPSALE